MHSLSIETRRLLEEHLNEVDVETAAGQNAVKQVVGRPGDPHHEFYKKLLVSLPATLAEVGALRTRLTKETDHEAMLRDVWKAAGETDADMRDGASATQDVSRGRAVVLRRLSVVLVRRLKEEVPHETYVRIFGSLSS
ncbi:hypothetical protein [Myxococcus qinghaiensis]|uniref:hypothetical protein n=1 Tax=Myxococcus qinghaiensis TaxID=2906758 RepID=UPI0020A7ECB4|nr:hypothetical protein [Myxococcus qinghaiensis]MCP3167308.1 hypothetical protein [Myxococcus qinghaiensis]